MWLRISSKYFVAGYDLQSRQIAPIIRYMKGWELNKIKSYCRYKGWSLEIYD